MSFSQVRPTHPAPRKKLFLSLGFIVASIIYVVWQHTLDTTNASLATLSSLRGTSSADIVATGRSYQAANDALLKTLAQLTSSTSQPQAEATLPVTQPTTLPSHTQTPSPTPTPTPVPTPPKPLGKYVDGSYSGTPADAYYGTVQVQVIVKNGQLADVQFLQYPNDRSNSRYINSQAMPLLTQEAIQAQSAQIDGVSGATFTSQAFQQSLASALTLAKR